MTHSLQLSLQEQLRTLIQASLARAYTSTSCHQEIPTDNHYQSVQLGDTVTEGFRSNRVDLLGEIDFSGKTVLDLGSNLGEISRQARALGADLVDGFEYDPYFVTLADLINALNRTTRVSFFETDITQPAVYDTQYDIVLAFSVFVYIRRILSDIARITRELLIIETHRLENNLDSYYIEPVSRLFPHYEMLGYTDWGAANPNSGTRAVIAFARDPSVLNRVLRSTSRRRRDGRRAHEHQL
jgi:SAM-dependent methyltransferase